MATLATVVDVESRLGRTLETSELPAVNDRLLRASALVTEYCGTPFSDGAPDEVRSVVVAMVCRVLGRGATLDGVKSTSESVGPISESYTFTDEFSSGDVWLNKVDRIILKAHRIGGSMVSIPMISERR